MTLGGVRSRARPAVGGTGRAPGGMYGVVTLSGIRNRASPSLGGTGMARGGP